MRLDDPRLEKNIHLGVMIGTCLIIPPSVMWWSESVPYIVALSVFAILYSAVASFQAAKAEENLDRKLEIVLREQRNIKKMLR